MKEPNINKYNNKDEDIHRYKDFFNSFNEASETDEVLQQLVNLNFEEEKLKKNKNNNFNEGNNSKIKFENYNDNDNLKEEKPISIILLKEKINRIYITMQGLNFKEKELINLNNFVPCLNNFEQKKYPQIDKLLEVFVSLISRIKDEINVKNKFIQKLNEASFDIENYEKKNIINQRVIKDKENEILILMNKLNLEKEKSDDKSKSIFLELNSLKKENQELMDTILIYKNKLRKTEAELQVINDKYKNNTIREIIKEKNIKDEEKSENGLNNSNLNDNKYFNMKKLNMSLIYLLKEINKMIIKYDNILINLLNKKLNLDKVIDLNCNIETNLLLDEANMKIFRKNFLYNMERIYKKIDILQKGNIDSREIKSSKNLIENSIDNSIDNSLIKNKNNISNDKSGNTKENEKHFKNNISTKWYDNYNNKKIGYIFDKEKVITCEDDDNGAK